MLAWLLLACACVCACALSWARGRRARALLAPLPCYPPLPLLGNVHQIFGSTEHFFSVIEDVGRKLEENNLPFVIWAGPQPVVAICDLDDVKAVTNGCLEKPYYYRFASEYIGNGLVTAPAAIWKRSIKKLAGTFTASIVDGYQGVFNAHAALLVQSMRGEAGGEPFDALHKYLTPTTFETICQTALGVPHVSDDIITWEYHHAFERTFELLIERGMNLLYHLDFVYHLTPAYKELKRCIAVLHNGSESIIVKRKQERAELKKKEPLSEVDSEIGKTKFKAFLDILLDLQETDPTMTDEQIRCEVDTVIIGGQDTAAVTLLCSFVMLGSRPDIQDKLHAEMKEIFGDSKRPVQKSDLIRMKYCEAITYETLRMYPALPVVMREADRDMQLKSCTIPKGTACAIHIWAAGRSKRAWGPDADQFRPERWLEEGGPPGYPASFFVFSYGRRACIGRRYAIPLMKTVLAHCVRELRFTSHVDRLRLKLDVALKPASGHLVQNPCFAQVEYLCEARMLEGIRKLGPKHCDLPTTMRQITTLLRLLSVDIDPRNKNPIPIIYNVFTFIGLGCYTYIYVFSMIWFVFVRCQQTGDVESAVVVFSMGVLSGIAVSKLIFVLFYQTTLKQIVGGYLAIDSMDVSNRFTSNLMKRLRVVKLRALIFWSAVTINGGGAVLKSLLTPGRHFIEDSFIFYGFEPQFESPNYEAAVTVASLAVVVPAYSPANITSFFIVVIGYTEAQMMALGEEMANLWDDAQKYYAENPETDTSEDKNETETKERIVNAYIKRRLEFLAKSHKTNLNLLTQIEGVFKWTMAVEFILLILGLIAVLLGGIGNTYQALPYGLMSVFVNCYIGQHLMDANIIFENAVYYCKWENFDVPCRKIVLLMLMNAQKTMQFSAGGVAKPNYACFMSIIRSIYSTYATLRSTMK